MEAKLVEVRRLNISGKNVQVEVTLQGLLQLVFRDFCDNIESCRLILKEFFGI